MVNNFFKSSTPASVYINSMDKFKAVLDVYFKLSTHVKVRDRAVKILQYGSQMLLGYYGTLLSKDLMQMLSLTRRSASTARKAFWLLKSVNHVKDMYELLQQYSYAKDVAFVRLLAILEAVFLILYYWYENMVFFARNKWVRYSEDDIEDMCNVYWFVSDFFGFLGSSATILLDVRDFYRHYVDYHDQRSRSKFAHSVQRTLTPVGVAEFSAQISDDSDSANSSISDEETELVGYNVHNSTESSTPEAHHLAVYQSRMLKTYNDFLDHFLTWLYVSAALYLTQYY